MSRVRQGSWRMLAAAALALPVAWACASAPDSAADVGADGEAAAEACVTGLVVSEGMPIAPRTLVRSEDGETVEITGTLAENIRRLSGAMVRVCGPDRTLEGALEVTRVRLLQVDGMPAVLGTLRTALSGWVLEPLDGSSPVILSAVPSELQAAEGAVVWVAGLATAEVLTVRSFAVLEGWR